MKTILVPTDFNLAAEKAMSVAVMLASKIDARVKLMTMLRFPKLTCALVESSTQSSVEYLESLRGEAQREIQRWKDWYPDVEIEGIVKEDFDQLIPAILSEEADLIVMGSEGANGWKDYLSGTNSQNVIRKADCPVLVLKENTQLDKLDRILFVTDFEKTGFIEKSQELLNLKNTKNHFVFIDAGEYDEDRKELYDRAKEVEKEYKIQNFDFEIYHHDNIPGGIIQYAEKLKIDLIVMYTHGRKGMQRFLFGSIAEQVVNSSTTPVLSVLEH
ncbi:MAG: universal stress protein [Cytophagaceae bacterium]|nr:universal stress protein [Cytophagaceae bacterium]